MSVAADTLGALRQAYAGHAAPRVRALHLPPARWNGTKAGEFGALELDDGSLGLAYLLLDDTLGALAGGGHADGLVGADALAVARGWLDADGVRRTLAFAAVNALTRGLFDRAGFAPPDAPDSIGGLDPRPGEHVGMIGFFPPLVKRVTRAGARLTVLELKADLAGERGGYRVTVDPRELASCDKVLSTSTVLLNDTLDTVLAHCAGASRFAMIGPGASCLPDALFARGVTLVGGVWVEHGAALKRALASGESWGQHARKFALPREGYPGIGALLAAAG